MSSEITGVLGDDDVEPDVEVFLSRADVARYIGLKSVRSFSGMQLPQHDVLVGTHRGWRPSTIDKWNESRPGRGRWGPR